LAVGAVGPTDSIDELNILRITSLGDGLYVANEPRNVFGEDWLVGRVATPSCLEGGGSENSGAALGRRHDECLHLDAARARTSTSKKTNGRLH